VKPPALVWTMLAWAAFAAAPLLAHDFWIVPSTFRPGVGGPIAVRLKVGEQLRGDPLPRDPAQIETFVLRGPAGETAIAGPPAAEPAGFAVVSGPGLYTIAYRSHRNRLDLPPEKFEEALKKEGLERIVELRRSRGESAKPSTEVFSRCAKSLLKVGDPAPAAPAAPIAMTGYDRPFGLTLELIPEKDPYQLAAGAELPVRVLYQGKPLAGILVVALSAHQADGRVAARSGRDGRVRLRLAEGGFWLIKAVHMVPAPPETGVDWESLWASLTFDLAAR